MYKILDKEFKTFEELLKWARDTHSIEPSEFTADCMDHDYFKQNFCDCVVMYLELSDSERREYNKKRKPR